MSIAIIPARGGSKRIDKKNIMEINGVPLIVYTIRQAINSKNIEEVWVSTDDHDIAKIAKENGAKIAWRTEELANDNATSESALIHTLNERNKLGLADPNYIVFLQCTSPIREPNDIDNAIYEIKNNSSDSLLSVCKNKRLFWKYEKGKPKSINYDFKHRVREQEMDEQFQENGSIYICKTKLLRESNNRIGGSVCFYIMNAWSSFQIDDPEDIELVSWYLSRNHRYAYLGDLPENLQLIIMDFDGVMTDDKAVVSDSGHESVYIHRGDGLGISRLKDAGFNMMVLSTEKNPVVEKRCNKIGIKFKQGLDNKLSYLTKYVKENNLELDNIMYVGNDVNDLDCMKSVAYPVAVSNAHPEVKSISKYFLQKSGGNGAIRELSDWLLNSN